jgi:hypothetical protein
LAGSERYEDSKTHNKKRMDESKENNKSLMNLKDCVRAKAKFAQEDGFVHVPWRSNKLTMLLKVGPVIIYNRCLFIEDLHSPFLTLNRTSQARHWSLRTFLLIFKMSPIAATHSLTPNLSRPDR